MNQCRGAGEEAELLPPRQAFGEDRKHIANGYLCSGVCTPLRPPSRAILPLLLSFPVANPSSHFKGTHTQVQILQSIKVAAQFINSLIFAEEVTAGSAPPRWWQQKQGLNLVLQCLRLCRRLLWTHSSSLIERLDVQMNIKTLIHQEVGEGKAPYNGTISPATLQIPPGKGVSWPDVAQGGEKRRLLTLMGRGDSLKQNCSQVLPWALSLYTASRSSQGAHICPHPPLPTAHLARKAACVLCHQLCSGL